MEIQLTRAIQAHDEELTQLTLKELTTSLVRLLGIPYRFDETGTPYPVAELTAKYISKLAGIPLSSVDQLSPVDFNNLSLVIIGFFLSSAETVETKLKEQTQKQQELVSE